MKQLIKNCDLQILHFSYTINLSRENKWIIVNIFAIDWHLFLEEDSVIFTGARRTWWFASGPFRSESA